MYGAFSISIMRFPWTIQSGGEARPPCTDDKVTSNGGGGGLNLDKPCNELRNYPRMEFVHIRVCRFVYFAG